jgi:hypothetical protein
LENDFVLLPERTANQKNTVKEIQKNVLYSDWTILECEYKNLTQRYSKVLTTRPVHLVSPPF